MTAVWLLVAAVALWWPAHVAGPLDGAPLDTVAEVIALGVLFPLLACLHRTFLSSMPARVLIVALLAWKALTIGALTQDGWCVSTLPAKAYVVDQTGRPHSWDMRADWRSADPACTAIMTRPFTTIREFPVWHFNLAPTLANLPDESLLPPKARTQMTVTGFLTTREGGRFAVETTPQIAATVRVDGHEVSANGADVPAGTHAVAIDAQLTGDAWRLVPTWNGRNIFREVATIAPPATVDRVVRPAARWIAPALVMTLLAWWLGAALRANADVPTIVWTVGASVAMAGVAVWMPERHWHLAIAALLAAAALPIAARAQTLAGAVLLIGVPWIVFAGVVQAANIGRLTFYSPGDDMWQFQRFAYRVFLQGYWLEGGEPTFWFQPLYRWIAGGIHLIVGDSSIGETFWDAGWLTAMAAFAFHVTKSFAGYRWGLVAAALTLAVFLAGPGFELVGRGLSEISSAGFLYVGALVALRSRGSLLAALAAGVFAVLGFYTRLNNLPVAAAVGAFAWPMREPARTIARPSTWFVRLAVPTIVIVELSLVAGVALFAWRTWHYTGHFSVLYGTQGAFLSVWKAGMTLRETASAMVDSVMMVLLMTDPPRWHMSAVPLVAGAVLSIGAALGIGALGELPFGVVLFSLATLSGAFVARGSAYAGRFSIVAIGALTTVAVCATAQVVDRVWPRAGGRVAIAGTQHT
jgi:hypothetical protein